MPAKETAKRRQEALASGALRLTMRARSVHSLGVAVSLLATCGCAPYGPPSILPYRDRPGATAYRITYSEMWDPAPVLGLSLLASREGTSARLEVAVTERPMDPRAVRHLARQLSDGEWRQIAECWESYSLFWEMGAPRDDERREFYRGLNVEGVRDGRYRAYADDQRHDAETRLRDCARRMIVLSGVRTSRAWWWSKPDEGTCADGTTPAPAESGGVDEVVEPDFFQGACPAGMSELTMGGASADGGHDRPAGHRFCLDYVPTEVTCADWVRADEYCRSRGKRLPTPEEWDWAVEGSPDEGFPRNITVSDPSPRGGRFRRDVDGGISFVGWGGWEWTSGSSGPGTAILREGRVFYDHTTSNFQRALAINTASRAQSYRAPFLTFRCAR